MKAPGDEVCCVGFGLDPCRSANIEAADPRREPLFRLCSLTIRNKFSVLYPPFGELDLSQLRSVAIQGAGDVNWACLCVAMSETRFADTADFGEVALGGNVHASPSTSCDSPPIEAADPRQH